MRGDLEALIKYVKDTPTKADAIKEILIPGEIECETEEKRKRNGISVDSTTWLQLEKIAPELSIEVPRTN